MIAYRKWTARVAVVAFAAAAALGVAILPVGAGRNGGTVWPLPEHFGRHHLFADLLMGAGLVAGGIGVIVLVGWVFIELLIRAEWMDD